MDVTLFSNDWYHGIINQTLGGHDDASNDAHLIAVAVLTGLCCVAQAIDHAADANSPDNMAGAICGLERIGDEIAEAIRERTA